MSGAPIDPVDQTEPPHWAQADGAVIEEFSTPEQWSDEQRRFVDWVSANLHNGLLPAGIPIDALSQQIGNLHKLEIVDAATDFVYRIYGERISRAANVNLQSRRVSELPEPTRSAFLAHYRELSRTPRIFVGALRYSGDIPRYPYWHRAVAPIGTDDICGFLVMTYPADQPAESKNGG